MQELISRAKELLADNTVARVLGWRAGDLPYNPEAAYFETPESLDEFVYDESRKSPEQSLLMIARTLKLKQFMAAKLFPIKMQCWKDAMYVRAKSI